MKRVFLFVAILGIISSSILINIKLKVNNKFFNNENAFVKKYNQLYVLGDSLSDTGSLVGAINDLGSNFIKLFNKDKNWSLRLEKPFYQNRSFSNGKVAAEVLADKLNLELKASWDFNFFGKNFNQKGNNYAVAGAQASEMITLEDSKGILLNNFTIDKQVDALLKQHGKIQEKDLILFEIGSNDLMFQALDVKTIGRTQEIVIEKSVTKQFRALTKLINNGSKNILLMDTPNLSQIPVYKHSNKFEIAFELSKNYNQKWSKMIKKLKESYPGINIKIFSLYDNFPKLLEDFANNKGNINDSAVSYQFNFSTFLNGKIDPECNYIAANKTIDDYFFFDFVHPTKNIHARVGEELYQLAIK